MTARRVVPADKQDDVERFLWAYDLHSQTARKNLRAVVATAVAEAMREEREWIKTLRGALEGIIYASDGCRGHKGCTHDMEPWRQARAALREEPR